ncbi:MAG TPA: hypothetical protein VIK27_01825 [Candidatus Aquilonibacter sp.]
MADEQHPIGHEAARGLPIKQDQTAEPVILDPHLPAMEKTGAVKTVLRNTLQPLMGAGSAVPGNGEKLMPALPGQPAPSGGLPAKPQEAKAAATGAAAEDGYVRLDVHFENGKLTVAGLKQVPGPLAIASAVIRGYAYEVLLEGQQVALGSVPDVGVRRAFANRDVAGPQGKHFFFNVPDFDFAVRFPRSFLHTTNLPKLAIVLHRVEDAPDRLTTLAPLAQQTGVKTTEIARLAGLQVDEIAPVARPAFEKLVNEMDRLHEH